MQIAKTYNGNLYTALEKWPTHLYVKNAIKRDNMVILLDIRDETGKTTCVTLPKTWIPIDLLDYVDKDSLVKSIQLRSFLRSGVLALVDADDAEKVLSTKEAVAEAKRCGIKNFRSDLTEGEEEKSSVKEQVLPKATTDKMDFYDVNLMTLEDTLIEAEADKIVADVCGNYAANADEKLFADEKTTQNIKNMREIANDKLWKNATAKLDELLKLIEDNAPKKEA